MCGYFRSALGTVAVIAILSLLPEAHARSHGHSDLYKIVSDLQSQVLALEEARNEDQMKILYLQRKLRSHFGVTAADGMSTEGAGDTTTTSAPSLTAPDTDPKSRSVTESSDAADGSSQGSPEVESTTVVGKVRGAETHSLVLQMLEGGRQTLESLDGQLKELKVDLDEVVKARSEGITAAEDLEEFRLEADSLREELLRVRRDLEELRAKRQEDALAARQAKSSHITTQWLQKTVEDLRNEMSELASSVNVTASLSQKQKEEAGLALARSEIADLRRRLDTVYVSQERDNAWVIQLKQDVGELRVKLQTISSGHQKLYQEVEELKDELAEKTASIAKSQGLEKNTGRRLPADSESSGHRMRHRGHLKEEVDILRDSVAVLQERQKDLLHEVRRLRGDHGDLATKIGDLERQGTDLANRSSYLGVEQRALSRQMETVQQQMHQTEKQTNDLKSTVSNITETGIKKLHASTLQLFKTLETLEDNYDRTIADIRKEMSKMEFSLAQVQSTVSEIREEQSTYEQTLKSVRHDMRRVQMESKRDRYKLMALKSDVINKTIQNSMSMNHNAFQELKLSDLESRIASLTKSIGGERMEVESLHKQIAEKADSGDLNRWERTQDRLREVVLNITNIIPRMTKEEETLHSEMDKFVRQLPADCAAIDPSQRSSVYLIQSPAAAAEPHRRAVRVFCDMGTAGGGWIVLQRRKYGVQDFNQNWSRYKEGFGDVAGDFWLGNELIHRLTTDKDYVLRIDLWDSAGRYKCVEYQTFRVLQESDGYRLAVGGYSGNASDALGYHNGMAFSTPDMDNDASSATHCAKFYGSGWWYNHCQYVNINGRYSTGITWYDIDGKEWSELTQVEMKIRPATAGRGGKTVM